MWLSQNAADRKEKPVMKIGVVTASAGRLVVSCDEEYTDFPVSGPGGIPYRPKLGDKVLMAEADGQAVCLGVLAEAEEQQDEGISTGDEGDDIIQILPSGEIAVGNLRILADGSISSASGSVTLGELEGANITVSQSGEIKIGEITVTAGGEIITSAQALTLRSASGASISLMADGSVKINEVVIGTDCTVRADGFLRN